MTKRQVAEQILQEFFSPDDYGDWDNSPCPEFERDVQKVITYLDLLEEPDGRTHKA